MRQSVYNEEVSLKELIDRVLELYKYILSKWLVILCITLLSAAIGYVISLVKKPIYLAEATFVLEDGEKSTSLGSYAGLASMVGIDLSSGGGVFQGDNILELYKSRTMISKTLLSTDTFNGRKDFLVNRYIMFNKLRDKWKDLALKKLNFSIPPRDFSIMHDSIITTIVAEINKKNLKVTKPDKKLSIIKVQFESHDELFAKVFVKNIVEVVNEFYILTKTKKSQENISILQRQADSLRKALNLSISGVAVALDANPNINPAFQSLRVPSQRRQVDVQANAAIYQEVVKNLELAKVSMRREKPLIQLIDIPVLPLQSTKLGKLQATLIGGALGGILCIIFLFLKRIFGKYSN